MKVSLGEIIFITVFSLSSVILGKVFNETGGLLPTSSAYQVQSDLQQALDQNTKEDCLNLSKLLPLAPIFYYDDGTTRYCGMAYPEEWGKLNIEQKIPHLTASKQFIYQFRKEQQ